MGLTTLIGYYADKGEALHAFQGLLAKVCGNGLVLIHKGFDGETSQMRHSLFRRPPFLVFIAIICALLTVLFPSPSTGSTYHQRITFLGCRFT